MKDEIINLDNYFMLKTFELAKKANGLTSPNPLVGSVIVKDGAIIGSGYHEKAGLPHAEIMALKNAGNDANGATLYVNLEPCSHFGKTPPCVYAIKKAGIKRVVAAIEDPNPEVSGRGFEYLEKNGIEVVKNILKEKAEKINEVFLKYIKSGMPFITIKNALTLDGKIGFREKKGKIYISSKKSLKYTHHLRFLSDAVMLSAKTVLNDNPSLDVRYANKETVEKFLSKKYSKIIIDKDLSISPNSHLFFTHGRTILFTSSNYDSKKIEKKMILEEKGAIIKDVGYNKRYGERRFLDLREIFKISGELSITSVLVESGPNLFNSLIEDGLYDKVIFNVVPYMFGTNMGLDLFDELTIKSGAIIKLKDLKINKIGDEFFIEYKKCLAE